jgi:UDP-N-acetylmuramoyl-L-alanyl-D-glutamate--2,6-diaminopimelate ligase
MLLKKIKDIFIRIPRAFFYSLINGFPSKKLHLIGITGTDGKTTTTNLICKVLQNANLSTDCISTINSHGAHMTCPHSKFIQEGFKKMAKNGIKYAICEITSHALDQYRFFGSHFDISAITNISHEHLDYHKNLDNYIQAKSKICNISNTIILNKDDFAYPKLSSYAKSKNKKIITISIKNKSQYQATNIKIDKKQMSFTVNNLKFVTNSNYYHQIYNILVAFAICQQIKIDTKIFLQTIKKFPEIPGRVEKFSNKLGINMIIDFAHTPQSLQSILSCLKQNTKQKLIVIFGATGGRDKSKRPLMGKIVSQYSDIAIITSDDTRQEKIEDINQDIISGIKKTKKFRYYDIPNRQEAFNKALQIAQKGDTIIACGKGHEKTILLGSTEYPWSEADAFRTAIKNLKK